MPSFKQIELSCLLVWSLLGQGVAIDGNPGQDLPMIRMRLELELDIPTCAIHENFPFKVRIVNPNAFAVELRGFELSSYIEPEVHLLLETADTLHLRNGATDSAWTRTPVTILPGGVVEKERLLWNDNLPSLAWPDEPGVYQLQLKTHLSTCRIVGESKRRRIDWERPIVELRVEAPSPLDRQASDWLYQRFMEQRRTKSIPGIPRDVEVERVRMYDEFLRRFSDSSYALAIRWETVKLLQDKLGNRAIPADDVEQMVDLFDECLTFCLKQGGAYAEEFLTWYADGRAGGSEVLELAFMHGRGALFKRLVEEIDRKYPDDAEGILYRRVIVAGLTESMEETDKIGQKLKNRFPNSRYARDLPRLLRQIKKQRKAYPMPE